MSRMNLLEVGKNIKNVYGEKTENIETIIKQKN